MEQSVVDTWLPRSQQTFAAEAIAVLTAVYNDASAIAGRDIVWVVDHEAAAASLIRGGSAEEARTSRLTPHTSCCTPSAADFG